MAPGAFEVGFVGLAHTQADLDHIVNAANDALAAP
jgi:glutamate-1-semialdehyde aminotransferase